MTPPPVSPGENSSIDEILDANAIGLLHFERFLPLVARVSSSEEFPKYEQVCARYDEQRGLNLGALGNDADAVEAMSAVLGDQLEEHVQLRRVLQMRWHGEAGDAVQIYLSAEHQAAAEFVKLIEDSHQTMSAAVDVLRDAVTDKAELFGGLDIDAVDGRTADEIDAILLASGIECVPFDRESVFPRLAAAFEELAERARGADVSDEFAAEVGERSRKWIHEEFVPRMKATCDAVLGACTSTDTAVRDSLALLVDVLGDVQDPSFGDLDERSWAIAPGATVTEPCPAVDDSSATPPATASAAATPAASAAPSIAGSSVAAPSFGAPNAGSPVVAGGTDSSGPRTPDDGSAARAGESLDGLVERVVAEIVDRVDEALSTAVPDDRSADDRSADDRSADVRSADDRSANVRGSDDIAPPSIAEPDGGSAVQDDPAGPRTESVPSAPPEQSPLPEQSLPIDSRTPGSTDERGHLEAELDGHRARIALEHDGAVTLRLETPGLGVRSCELRIGPFGLPEIVEIPGAADSADANQSSIPAATPPSEPVPTSEPVPPTNAAPADSAPTEPTPTEPTPTEPTPTEPTPADSVPSQGSDPMSPDAQAQCLPESPTDEPTVQPDADEDEAGHHPSAAQHPVSADLPRPPAESQDSSTGAGLSEAGTL
ncbi:hypothetical protein [Rhodococcoides yunnanense]|uniref:DUF222 domain-containing protein n=1 Tax=Rhodococcoides yunnanense TaxID=278209 RepID=A0ABU4BGS6_9NOCA|nr:hypothetical protein [Rhodococcus yunnanensis]MDV6263388.1 hypothetical protein [Rhodococcus yunnanensis]